MKKTILKLCVLTALCFSAMFSGGCKTFTATVDVLDAIVGDPIIHEGTVNGVWASDDATTISFTDGMSYTCKGVQFVSPGMNVKIRDGENGMYAE